MSLNDSKYQNLEANLNAIGKAVFVNFYYDFKDMTVSTEVLAEKLLRDNPKSRSTRQGFRIPRARHIFEIGQEIEALKIIIDSERVDPAARDKAKHILSQEITENERNIEAQDEANFNIELSRGICYTDKEEFEYDNQPRRPKNVKSSNNIKRYPRSRTVAANALLHANYMCEVDNSHKLFKRKNSNINYTEPHHIVPLYAADDFPNIDLDREQNVISLCSHCHNLLHYGNDFISILRFIYDERKVLLEKIGINISFDQLLEYYK